MSKGPKFELHAARESTPVSSLKRDTKNDTDDQNHGKCGQPLTVSTGIRSWIGSWESLPCPGP